MGTILYDGLYADEVRLPARETGENMPLETPDQLARLNALELRALQLKACGLTDDEAAVALKTTSETVTWRLRSSYGKLGYGEETETAREITNKATRAVCVLIRAKMIPGPYKGSVPPPFSEKELSVLRLLVLGFSTELIAHHLSLKLGTVRSRINMAAYKCGTTSRAHLAAITVAHGLA